MDQPRADARSASAPSSGEPPGREARAAEARVPGRREAIPIAIAVVLLASLVAGIVAFAGDGGDDGGDGLATAEGIVVDADEGALVVELDEPIDGSDRIEFEVLPEDRSAMLTTEHLLYHASSASPIRVRYERDGDSYLAREAFDLPTLP